VSKLRLYANLTVILVTIVLSLISLIVVLRLMGKIMTL
jgi:hypothetical protein